jgi:flagellin
MPRALFRNLLNQGRNHMPLGVLNNISAIYAENNLNQTQSSLQNTLTQLSSGSRINSGADDPAGLAIADGLSANSSALTQSSSNASEGVGFLQVADGALSQVTNLLNSAVTLATEAGGGTLSSSQMSAANQEYQDILNQIDTIGSTTEYNGIQVFSEDTSMSALTWAQGTGTAASSATATGAALVAAANLTAGGTTAGVAVTQAGAYNTSGATSMTWVPQSTNGSNNNVLVSGPILSNQSLTGTLTFTPTHSSGTPGAVSVNLGTALTAGSSLSSQATQLATALNTAAGASDYAVTVVNGNQLQIALTATGTGANLTGFVAPAATGSIAAQTGYAMTAVNGDSLTGSMVLTSQSTTAAGTAAGVNFTGNGTSSVGATITSGDTLAGSVTISANITQGTAQSLSWTNSGSGATQTFSTTLNTADVLTGSFTITGTGDSNSPYTISLSALHGENASQVASTIAGDITSGSGTPGDYSVNYNATTGQLTIGLSGNGSETGISVANSSGSSAASQASPASTPSATVSLAGVTTGNLQNTLQSTLGSNYTVTYNSGTGALAIGLSGGGSGSTVSFSANSVTQATPASVANSSSSTTISLAGTNTANLASVVGQALNGVKNGTSAADYSVAYNSTTGALSVGLTSQAATDGITGIAWGSGAISQTSSSAASVAVNDGDTLGGTLTINQTIGGASQSPVTVNLTGATTNGVAGGGTSTASSGAALISAVNTALGNNAQYYNVGYNVNSSTGVGTLSIGVNAAGAAANVDSVSIANGTSSNALFQTETTNSSISVGSSVLGNFTLTPTGSSTTPINVDLSNTTTANLVSKLQTALGSSYLVGYTASGGASLAGTLSIGVSAAGVAAGITGFTLAEATAQAASTVSAPAGGVNIYTSDGTSAGSQNYNVTVGNLSDSTVGTSSSSSNLGTQITVSVGGATGTGGTAAGGTAGTSLTGTGLTSQADAEAALQTVDNAISAVAYQRGQVGANINTLNAASNIASSEETNITSAQNAITATDYASATSNLSKFEILTQTGISALAQANSTQQMVTKLLQ